MSKSQPGTAAFKSACQRSLGVGHPRRNAVHIGSRSFKDVVPTTIKPGTRAFRAAMEAITLLAAEPMDDLAAPEQPIETPDEPARAPVLDFDDEDELADAAPAPTEPSRHGKHGKH